LPQVVEWLGREFFWVTGLHSNWQRGAGHSSGMIISSCAATHGSRSSLTIRHPGSAASTLSVPSRAFFRVTELKSGSVVLRATPRLSDYCGSAIERVWEVLRPVLPQGVVPTPLHTLPEFAREARL